MYLVLFWFFIYITGADNTIKFVGQSNFLLSDTCTSPQLSQPLKSIYYQVPSISRLFYFNL